MGPFSYSRSHSSFTKEESPPASPFPISRNSQNEPGDENLRGANSMFSGDFVKTELSRAGLTFPEEVHAKLSLYVQELLHWNKKMNLTALEGEQLVRRLIVEPAWIGEQLQMSGSLADVGSGNGSPGIPLCVTRNLAQAHLVEARTKRAAFLRHLASRLQLQGITVHRSRVEDIAGTLEPVDWISLQAVSPAPALIAALRRLFPATTRVVWITSGSQAPSPSASRISVPSSNSEAWIFQLDQF
jgi:16S rRNA (guanine(527)-N(7))-methyltransferase RsmG